MVVDVVAVGDDVAIAAAVVHAVVVGIVIAVKEQTND